jgi:hypothetical protein
MYSKGKIIKGITLTLCIYPTREIVKAVIFIITLWMYPRRETIRELILYIMHESRELLQNLQITLCIRENIT